MAAVAVEAEPAVLAAADTTPPTPTLNRVGSLFVSDSKSSGDQDASFYVLGSIGRLCNEVDDITLESNSTRTAPGSNSPELAPITRVPTAYNRDLPVFSWESRASTLVDDGTSLEDMLQKRRNPGSSLAPQSSSDPSDDERSEAPSVGQFRPGTDLIQCPVEGCGRTFKWKKNLHHHIRDKHPTDAAGLSVMRIQPAHVGAAHNGFRLQNIASAPPIPLSGPQPMLPPDIDPSLRCPECGKTFSRKGDLVHHKRYHTRSTDRPYKCDQCGQGFIHHKDLARHMPRHTGQRSFQCPFLECHKNYTRKDNLNRHMRHDHGGLGVTGEVWTGVESVPMAIAPQPTHMPMPVPSSSQPLPQELPYEPLIDPNMAPPNRSHLAAVAEAASNHALLQDSEFHAPLIYSDNIAGARIQPYPDPLPQLELQPTAHAESRNDTSSSEPSANGSTYPTQRYREGTPSSLGKRPIASPPSHEHKPTKRPPKQKWAHRLGCPFRKCRPDLFSTEQNFRVCETTPHEFIIRLIEHMKRNHDLYVCGECFLGFASQSDLGKHKESGHHCGKCYLPFESETTFIAHAIECKQVDASTQEDIWQILYETLCGDGVRHNSGFDDNEPTDDAPMAPSNAIRMQVLAKRALAPGQVPSLAERLKTSTPINGIVDGEVSGNALAPPVVQHHDDFGIGRQGESDGAAAHKAPDIREATPPIAQASRVDSALESGLEQAHLNTIAALSAALAQERDARQIAEGKVDTLQAIQGQPSVQAALQRFISMHKSAKLRRRAAKQQPKHLQTASKSSDFAMLDSPPIPYFGDDVMVASAQYLLPAPRIQDCPSLTSSDDTFANPFELALPPNLGQPLATVQADMAGNAASNFFSWNQGSSDLWNCQQCGNALGLDEQGMVICATCSLHHEVA